MQIQIDTQARLLPSPPPLPQLLNTAKFSSHRHEWLLALGSCSRRRAHHSRLLFHCHYVLAYVQLPLVGEHQLCKLFINGTKTFRWNLRCVMRLCVRMIFISLSLSFLFLFFLFLHVRAIAVWFFSISSLWF